MAALLIHALRVSIGDGDQVVVRARPGAATYSTDADRLTIDARGLSDTFAIEIPRAAPKVVIRSGGVRLLVAQGGQVVAPVVPDTLGVYQLPLHAVRPR